jgi:uncharacterized protein (DUF302 family)
MTELGYQIQISEGYDEAVTRTRLALRGEGFSILTEAHVGDMLGSGERGRQYLIMGAWNVPAGQTLGDSGVSVGVHLPCNVVVQETGATAIVAALDPADTVNGSDPVADEIVTAARDALKRALERIATNA